MTVGGSFQARTNAVRGTVAVSPGHGNTENMDLTVDLRTLDTGIALRTEHMKESYLEVDRAPGFDKASLVDVALMGVDPDDPAGKGMFTAVLALHGMRHSVSGSAEIKRAGNGLRVKASFPLQLSDYNIPEPRYLGVGVKNQLQVEVTFTAAVEGGDSATR